MYFTSHFFALLATASAIDVATVYKVNVGANGLTFSPNNFTAEVGSFVEFIFFPKNHSVTQSSFSAPCQPLNAPLSSPNPITNTTPPLPQIHSGFLPTPPGGPNPQTFTIKITSLSPLHLYCAQPTGSHCQSGMVLGINNPLTGPNTFAAYLALARAAQSPSRSPEGGAVQGGVLAPVGWGTVGVSSTSATVMATSRVVSEVVGETGVVQVTTWSVVGTATSTVVETVTQGMSASASATGTGTVGSSGAAEERLKGWGLMGVLGGVLVAWLLL